ncbi:ribosome maturation factor RimP [Algicola sagamiensis]|uniref:ribosome maturation factor RimP n=1 Tax=Algicola sagamiensis TaxID=163869 RepID=UPI0003AB3DC3|nr:ribosome maturation factor RimP [Algicola sagamiensis]
MAKLEDQLTEMLTPAVEAEGFELLGIEFIRAKQSTLRLYIDHENGINVDDCAVVSHQVSAVLDVEDPISTEYTLEVSSPGMDRPLFKQTHYEAVVGEEISLRLNMPQDGRRKFKGELKRVENDMLVIDVDGTEFMLMLGNVEKANLVPNFKK